MEQSHNPNQREPDPLSPTSATGYATLFEQLVDWLQFPMAILGLIWLILFVLEVTTGLHPLLVGLGMLIWVVFIIDFALELGLAPDHLRYLRANWLTAVALFIPALRVFRIARAVRALGSLRALRGVHILRVITSANRSMRALQATLVRRGLGYVVLLTAVVLLAGSAGMFAIEGQAESAGFQSYPEALYWTAMLMTTISSEYWPQTPEGRLLTVLISLFAVGVFGYIAASLAAFLVGRDAENDEAEIAGQSGLDALREEIHALRQEVRELARPAKLE